ncbi:glutathione-dependent formaldehyde-activating enzyme [Hysterangium stoloniferum]|nr:glutathione-dependent formaldehyde-activating enzyme [Hysterangium stoloniferum]
MSSEGSSIPVTGSCLCGNVTYKIDAPITLVGICHCDNCRRVSGAAYNLGIGVPRAAINVTGETKEYVKAGGSGQDVHHVFCPNCGSPLWSASDSNKEISFVKGGTLSVEIQKTLQPNMELFSAQRLPYITDRYGKQA